MVVDVSDIGIVMTAWRRPKYLRRSLTSWAVARNTGYVRRYLLALGRSGLQNDMIRIAHEEFPQLKIKVRLDSPEAQASPAMHRAIGEAVDYILEDQHVRYVICAEEDVVVSDDVLEYFDWARGIHLSSILTICAHNVGGCGWDRHTIWKGGVPDEVLRDPDTLADQTAVHILPYFNPWVWGFTRDAWTQVIRPQWDWDQNSGGMNDSGYDWNMAQRIMPRGGWHAVVPEAARSQNIGRDEGVYSSPAIYEQQVALSFREHREPVAYRLEQGVI